MSQKRSRISRSASSDAEHLRPGRSDSHQFSLRFYIPVVVVISFCIVGLIVFSIYQQNTSSGLRQAIERDFINRRYLEAELKWEKLAQVHPEQISPEDRIQWAVAALRADHMESALSILNQWRQNSPEKPEGWLMILDIYRFLGQPDKIMDAFEELRLQETAFRSAPVLMKVTIGLLTDLDPEEVRDRLKRWADAEQNSPMAAATLQQRYLENPLPSDPSRDERLRACRQLVSRFPDSIESHAVLAELLMTSGLMDEAAEILQNWPGNRDNDVNYHRLSGRYLQDVRLDHANAIISFQKVLEKLPHDWKTRYRLARALKAVGHLKESQDESVRMLETREKLEPASLEPIIRNAFPRGKAPEPASMIVLLNNLNLIRLAESWQDWQAEQSTLRIR